MPRGFEPHSWHFLFFFKLGLFTKHLYCFTNLLVNYDVIKKKLNHDLICKNQAYRPQQPHICKIETHHIFLSSCSEPRENMGKSSLVVETYPSFNANHKNDKKQSKTRAAAKLAKIAKFNAENKASLRIQRKKAQKEISKSRNRKRNLKSTEAGITNVPEGIQYNQREMSIENEAQKKKFDAFFEDAQLEMEMEWIRREKKAGRFVPIPKNFEIIRRANERSAKR